MPFNSVLILTFSLLLIIINLPLNQVNTSKIIPFERIEHKSVIENASIRVSDQQPKKPIIIIPGFGGSKIEAKLNHFHSKHWFCSSNKDWYLLWISLDDFLPIISECSIDYFTLFWNGNHVENKRGAEFRVVPSIDGIVYLEPTFHFENYFLKMVDGFKSIGYQENFDLFGAPYDFRLSPRNLTQYFHDLTGLIEYTYGMKNERVTLICHSMGCKLSIYFLSKKSQKWKDKHIEQLITIAPAFSGAFEGLRSLLFGNNFGDDFMTDRSFRSLIVSCPGIYFDLPSNTILWPDPLVISDTKDYYSTKDDYLGLFYDLEFPQESTQILKSIWNDVIILEAPKVKTRIFFGYGTNTRAQVVFKGDLTKRNYYYINKDGDGVLSKELILQFCKAWTDNSENSCQGFPGIKHQELVSNEYVIKNIIELITKKEL
ncbi:phosphatidylcholine-sterol acyltransferase [Anaeramoeba flamelloides]|uniref:Phosphatidylcholine-sterol acyltransferase n=1 Tax=Anaeramoeba flamelloides TaxID=1746091 RepID=A0ABQ8Y8I4_9EUKA|nr:phosphatidylcholine-sterol acyltransferase [Anaeramoeba flamelloides]